MTKKKYFIIGTALLLLTWIGIAYLEPKLAIIYAFMAVVGGGIYCMVKGIHHD